LKTPAVSTFVLLLLAAPLIADGPADNVAEKVRRIPPPGIEIPEPDRASLHAGLELLDKRLKTSAAH
jgi:hypothetical protein